MEFARRLYDLIDDDARDGIRYKPRDGTAKFEKRLNDAGLNDGRDAQKYSDIEFIVGPERTSFYGLRFIFGLFSSYFEQRLFGDDSCGPTLELPDVSAEGFRAVFSLAYGLPPTITIDNVMDVLETASRFNLDVLIGECLGFLGQNINGRNVLSVFDAALQQNILTPPFEMQCCKVILKKSKQVLESDAFLTTSVILMQKILECEFFFVDETRLWQRLVYWAKTKTAMDIEAELDEEKSELPGVNKYDVGDEVILVNGKVGRIVFKGEVNFAGNTMFGIDLRNGKGNTNGTVDDVEYFTASEENSGVFVRATRIGGFLPKTDRDQDSDEAKATEMKDVMLEPNSRDVKYLRQVIEYVRFPVMNKKYFIEKIVPLLPRAMAESVLISFVAPRLTGIFPSGKRKNWNGEGGKPQPYEVIAASAELEKAQKLPNEEEKAEWSRIKMEGGPQWFIVDTREPLNISSITIKNFYQDADTLKDMQVHALQPGIEYTDAEAKGDNWSEEATFVSAKSTAWQTIAMETTTTSRYWKFTALSSYGGADNYICLDHLKLFGVKAEAEDEDVDDDDEEDEDTVRMMEQQYEVVFANQALDRAKQLPLRGASSEWSGATMQAAGGAQYFVADLGEPATIKQLEVKHRYSDNDTIRELEVYYLPLDVDFTPAQQVDEGGAWVKACDVLSMQTTNKQSLDCEIPDTVRARFWKFRVISLYGGGLTAGHYPCMNHMIILVGQPMWTTGLAQRE